MSEQAESEASGAPDIVTNPAEVLTAPEGGGVPSEEQSSAAPATGPWDGLEGDDKGLVEVKGWKTLPDALRSYRNLEKLRGVPEDQLLRIPGKEAGPEAWEALYARLGRPEKPEEYGIEVGEGQVDLSALAHKAGLSVRQAKTLLEGITEVNKGRVEQSEAQYDAQCEREFGELRREWGAEADKNVMLSQRATQALGWDNETVDKLQRAMGTRWIFEQLHKVGRGLGEHGGLLSTQPGSGFGMTQEAARVEYATWQSDPDKIAKLQSSDKNVRMAAAAERGRLRQMGWPDES